MATDPFAQLLASEKDRPARGVSIEGLRCRFRSFDGAQAESLMAASLDAKGSTWRGCFFDMPAFTGARLVGAVFDHSSMVDPIFADADLTLASLQHVVWSSPLFSGAVMDEIDATGATLNGAAFGGASLKRSCFKGASLDRASFRGCDLTDADLTGAKLEGADFQDAILHGVRWDP